MFFLSIGYADYCPTHFIVKNKAFRFFRDSNIQFVKVAKFGSWLYDSSI